MNIKNILIFVVKKKKVYINFFYKNKIHLAATWHAMKIRMKTDMPIITRQIKTALYEDADTIWYN